MTVNEEKLMSYVNQAVGDFGSVLSAALVTIGDKLGLFEAMVGAGPLTPTDLAKKTGTTERYVAEWASGLAAAGYLDYAGDGRYELNAEQAIALADESSPAYVIGGFQAMLAATPRRAKSCPSLSHGRRDRLARARSRLVPRDGAVLSARLRGKSRPVLDPSPRRH